MPKSMFYNQDPSVSNEQNTPWLGEYTAPSGTGIPTGLNGPFIAVANAANVRPNANGNFFFTPGTTAFRQTHTYTVTRITRELVNEILVANGDLAPSATMYWQWGVGALTINVDAGIEANAYYDRNIRGCRYYHTNSPSLPSGTMFTADSSEIVSHETGHGSLDFIQPGWLTSRHPQTGALHEAFGDIMSVSFCLSRLDMVSRLAGLSGGDLHKSTFLTQMGEQFGKSMGLPFGLRNADNDKTITQLRDRTGRIQTEPHLLSEIFTGGYYDILVDVYNQHLRESGKAPVACLMDTSKWMLRVLFKAIKNSPTTNATFEDVVEAMKNAVITNAVPSLLANRSAFAGLVNYQFYTKRGIRGTGLEQNTQRVAIKELSECLRANYEAPISDEDAAHFVKQSQPNLMLPCFKRHREADELEHSLQRPSASRKADTPKHSEEDTPKRSKRLTKKLAAIHV